MSAVFDHLVFAARALREGVRAAEESLGLPLGPGGRHARMGTCNRLLRLGAEEYLEAIAVDPDAPKPDRPRWFGLDRFAGLPRIVGWVLRCDDLEAALAEAPPGTGASMRFSRDDLSWRMAVPDDGRLPFDGAFPALIQWDGSRHATDSLPEADCVLSALQIVHPEPDALTTALAALISDARISVAHGPETVIRAEIDTPLGRRIL